MTVEVLRSPYPDNFDPKTNLFENLTFLDPVVPGNRVTFRTRMPVGTHQSYNALKRDAFAAMTNTRDSNLGHTAVIRCNGVTIMDVKALAGGEEDSGACVCMSWEGVVHPKQEIIRTVHPEGSDAKFNLFDNLSIVSNYNYSDRIRLLSHVVARDLDELAEIEYEVTVATEWCNRAIALRGGVIQFGDRVFMGLRPMITTRNHSVCKGMPKHMLTIVWDGRIEAPATRTRQINIKMYLTNTASEDVP